MVPANVPLNLRRMKFGDGCGNRQRPRWNVLKREEK